MGQIIVNTDTHTGWTVEMDVAEHFEVLEVGFADHAFPVLCHYSGSLAAVLCTV